MQINEELYYQHLLDVRENQFQKFDFLINFVCFLGMVLSALTGNLHFSFYFFIPMVFSLASLLISILVIDKILQHQERDAFLLCLLNVSSIIAFIIILGFLYYHVLITL